MDYCPEKGISFLSFARICVERHVITAIKSAGRRKQNPLNTAISLECFTDEYDTDFNLADIVFTSSDLDPGEMLLRCEDRRMMRDALKALLSDFEWQVLLKYQFGKSYREIAAELACKPKSVDNALGRIKRKIGKSAPGLGFSVSSYVS